jgi:hypothetical protein
MSAQSCVHATLITWKWVAMNKDGANLETTITRPPSEPVVRSVSRFEAILVRMLRTFMNPPAGESSLTQPKMAAGKLTIPRGLSADCLHLVRETLSKGCVQYLSREGGWRRGRFLRDGKRVEGRLWERSTTRDLALSFSGQTIKFLMWLTAGRPDAAKIWNPSASDLTVGDQFLMFLAYEAFRGHEAQQTFRAKSQFVCHGLVRLFFPEDFIGAAAAEIDCKTWTQGVGSNILEALQPRLQRRLLEVERAKAGIGDWGRLRGLGQSQDQALAAFMSACESAKRPDLARPLLAALGELLSRDLTPAFWNGGLVADRAPTRLADRVETQRQALVLLRYAEQLAGWSNRYAGTSYFDEDYQIAQSWLSDWELYRGEELTAVSWQLLYQIEPLRMTIAASPMSEVAAEPTNASSQRE